MPAGLLGGGAARRLVALRDVDPRRVVGGRKHLLGSRHDRRHVRLRVGSAAVAALGGGPVAKHGEGEGGVARSVGAGAPLSRLLLLDEGVAAVRGASVAAPVEVGARARARVRGGCGCGGGGGGGCGDDSGHRGWLRPVVEAAEGEVRRGRLRTRGTRRVRRQARHVCRRSTRHGCAPLGVGGCRRRRLRGGGGGAATRSQIGSLENVIQGVDHVASTALQAVVRNGGVRKAAAAALWQCGSSSSGRPPRPHSSRRCLRRLRRSWRRRAAALLLEEALRDACDLHVELVRQLVDVHHADLLVRLHPRRRRQRLRLSVSGGRRRDGERDAAVLRCKRGRACGDLAGMRPVRHGGLSLTDRRPGHARWCVRGWGRR
eukprot:Rhum_TRINITY_DN14717_c5_g1::Rhum_TRINITY_DN14717_c5_g1_i1::g.113859::m.113859